MDPAPPPRPAYPGDADGDDAEPSLWRELIDGSAGPSVKAFVCLALAPLFAGLGIVASYVVTGMFPSYSGRNEPDDELVAGVLCVATLLYLLVVAWIWTRRNRGTLGPLWRAGLQTFLIGVATLVIGFALEINYGSSVELLIAATVCLAIGGVVLVWIQGVRRFSRAVPLTNRADGALDIRCPACGYRMVGLHESRCPECGTAYTLDELLGRQVFLTRDHRRLSAVPAPPLPNGGEPGSGSPVVTG